MGELTRSELITRRVDGAWMLHGSPPDKLRKRRLAAADG
jgi:hypothetical protein